MRVFTWDAGERGASKRSWADAEGEYDPDGVLHGVPKDTTVVGNPLEGVPAEGEPPPPRGPPGDEPPPEEGDGLPRLPCGAVAGAAQCMCMICLGGEDAGEASTVGDSQEAQGGGDAAMGEEEDL